MKCLSYQNPTNFSKQTACLSEALGPAFLVTRPRRHLRYEWQWRLKARWALHWWSPAEMSESVRQSIMQMPNASQLKAESSELWLWCRCSIPPSAAVAAQLRTGKALSVSCYLCSSCDPQMTQQTRSLRW